VLLDAVAKSIIAESIDREDPRYAQKRDLIPPKKDQN